MEISNLYSTSTILVEYERTTKRVPTMKLLGDVNKKNDVNNTALHQPGCGYQPSEDEVFLRPLPHGLH